LLTKGLEMSGSFSVEWLPGGVLLQTRTGTLTVQQAEQYVAAVRAEVLKAPTPWGAVIDTRGAAAQSEEVQEVIQRLIKIRRRQQSGAHRDGVDKRDYRAATAPSDNSTRHARPVDRLFPPQPR
jgi:hypothetical protein